MRGREERRLFCTFCRQDCNCHSLPQCNVPLCGQFLPSYRTVKKVCLVWKTASSQTLISVTFIVLSTHNTLMCVCVCVCVCPGTGYSYVIFFIVAPCTLMTAKFPFTYKYTFYWTYKMLKFTLKYLIFSPTCFGPFGPSSGSLHWAWLKLHFCRNDQL